DGQERTEEATPKRLEDARKKGQIARSRELNTMAMLLLGALGLMGMAPFMIGRMEALFRTGLSLSREAVFDPWAMIDIFSISIMLGIALVMPLMVLMLVTAILAPLTLGGWSFSVEGLGPKFDKLNPLKGLKRIFALRGLVELLKALAKFLLIGGVGAMLLVHNMPRFNGLAYETVPRSEEHTSELQSRENLV